MAERAKEVVAEYDQSGTRSTGQGLFSKAMQDPYHYYVKLRSGEFFKIETILRFEEVVGERFAVVTLYEAGKYYRGEGEKSDWSSVVGDTDWGLARNEVAINIHDIMVFADAGE